jgi:GT2 family glycosyltransferase
MPGKDNPLVSILILNWNGKDLLGRCLESLQKTEYSPLEIIVVDNASTDGSQKIVKLFQQVKLVQNKENLGYAAGNNRGFLHACGKYIVTLNNDIEVSPSWLNDPVRYLEHDEKIGIISCRQMQFKNRELIDVLFSYPSSSLLFRPLGAGKKMDNKLHLKQGFVIGANGASAVYRKKMLDQIGMFDERFFAYHEESDLCMRAFYSGWKCMYAPQSVVYHKGSQSFKQRSRTFYYYHERNRIWFIAKNYPVEFIIRNFFWLIIMELRLIRVIIFKACLPLVYFQARLDAFRQIKKFLIDGKKKKKPFNELKKVYYRFMREKILYDDPFD